MNKRQFLKGSIGGAISAASVACQPREAMKTKRKNNVLLIAIDDLNAWIIDPMRHPLCKTPNIDALMSRSVRFTNAHCAAPVCASSRAAFMSGVPPHVSGVYTNAQSIKSGARKENAHTVISDIPHLVDLYRSAGYHTVGAGKIYHRWVSDEKDHSKHYDRFMSELTVPEDIEGYGHGYAADMFYPFPKTNPIVEKLGYKQGQSLVAGPVDRATNMFDGFMPDELITQWSVNELKNLPADKPFFMGVGFLRPHVPFTAPQKYFDAIPLDKIELPKVDDMKDIPAYGKAMTMGLVPGGDHAAVLALGETYWKQLIQGYLASIAFVDDQVGALMEQLVSQGLDKTTDIVLLSDHGQNFGEKANWRKMCLWEESTRVPFMIRPAGGVDGAVHSDSAVSLLDLYPTLCALSGLPKHEKLYGNDLSPLLRDPNQAWDKPALIAWHYGNFAVRSNRWRLIKYRDNTMELYDHDNDPLEKNNLVQEPEYEAVIRELLAFIPKDPAIPAGKAVWEGDKLDGYINQWKKSGVPAWLGG